MKKSNWPNRLAAIALCASMAVCSMTTPIYASEISASIDIESTASYEESVDLTTADTENQDETESSEGENIGSETEAPEKEDIGSETEATEEENIGSETEAPEKETVVSETEAPEEEYTASDANREINQQQIYTYLTEQLKLNPAAAIGILINIEADSNYDPQYTSDSFYGLCQWNLTEYRGKSLITRDNYQTVAAQLEYMSDELMSNFLGTDTLAAIQNLANTAEGAGEAAYIFASNYEQADSDECIRRKQLATEKFSSYYEALAGIELYAIDSKFTGLKEENNVLNYYVNGALNIEFTGLLEYNNTLVYIEKGILNKNYSGLAKYNNQWLYIKNGVYNTDYTGLTKYYSTWYYVDKGTLNWNYTGLAKYQNIWYYVEKGIRNENYTGLVKYYSTWYYVDKGTLNWNYTSLAKYQNTWYYVEKGIRNENYTGLVKYYSTWYYVDKGIVNWNYTGPTKYYSTTYYIRNGILDFSYSAALRINGTSYKVVNGVMLITKSGWQNPSNYPQVSCRTVELPSYCTGYFTYVTPSRIAADATRQDCIDAFIARAYEYLGTRYIEPWSSWPGDAVDCSGLVLQCLYATGMDLKIYNPYNHRWLANQTYNSMNWYYNNTFMPVSVNNIRRGDVVYYRGHIAIYLGDDKIIDSWPGQGVGVHPINSRGTVIGAGRPFV